MYSKRTYRKRNGKDSIAICLLHKRRIEVSMVKDDAQRLETVVHELYHAYVYEMCTHSANLDHDAREEVGAEIMSKRGYELLQLGDVLNDRLAALLEKRAGDVDQA